MLSGSGQASHSPPPFLCRPPLLPGGGGSPIGIGSSSSSLGGGAARRALGGGSPSLTLRSAGSLERIDPHLASSAASFRGALARSPRSPEWRSPEWRSPECRSPRLPRGSSASASRPLCSRRSRSTCRSSTSRARAASRRLRSSAAACCASVSPAASSALRLISSIDRSATRDGSRAPSRRGGGSPARHGYSALKAWLDGCISVIGRECSD
mmetsp:Transcript_20027/g.49983  ORF Transcript_20027/g.49983 Transcript_20027/m.49983 type:complete len:211 (-) Transcript_20027:255-887(-)